MHDYLPVAFVAGVILEGANDAPGARALCTDWLRNKRSEGRRRIDKG